MQKTFEGRTVLVTGHTGFKGSWLAIWLREMGAEVIGYSLAPPTTPNNFELTGLSKKIMHIEGDVRDYAHLKKVVEEMQPEIVFHLAAQALVIPSYANPRETFESNASGTVNMLEAARESPFIKAMVMITTDKCYENKEWIWGYRENDPLGGSDPYSASKAMAEIAISSYRKSFFSKNGPLVASARAGNVIGGGDFAEHRILPDTMKALMDSRPIEIRNPQSIRPWMHVLDPLKGYLQLAACLLEKGKDYAQAWNFGPMEHQAIDVKTLVVKAIDQWGSGEWISIKEEREPKSEMPVLRLNWDKAANLMGWYPSYNWEDALCQTVEWFKAYNTYIQNGSSVDFYQLCANQIEEYLSTKAMETR
jgi:CDP-glucose 4,6-dehydratase